MDFLETKSHRRKKLFKVRARVLGNHMCFEALPSVPTRAKSRLRTDHRALQELCSKESKASTRISGWLATLIEYPMQIEYVSGSENAIADALSRLDSMAIDSENPSDLAREIPTYACPIGEVDRLDARTD